MATLLLRMDLDCWKCDMVSSETEAGRHEHQRSP